MCQAAGVLLPIVQLPLGAYFKGVDFVILRSGSGRVLSMAERPI